MSSFELFDPARLFIGEVPGTFYLEVIGRSIFIFVILILAMRLMGKRMSSQMSRNEMAAVSSLAAAIGVPLMDPTRGVLPSLVVAAVIVAWQLIIAKWSMKSPRFEKISQDEFNILVKDGVMVCDQMKNARISRERLCAQLRSQEIYHLGEVSRLYLEAGGMFSLVKNEKPEPGLSVLPNWDEPFAEQTIVPEKGWRCCWRCGKVVKEETAMCPVCNGDKWTPAVLVKTTQS
ncbi:DUF421 domain-containing protein [Pedobacter yulinensis]|uniref:DUF421 domain-containing protein n=1 Tax=Pedobacter yulinensis TaxID=2126353 RepID=A0A2T3HK40_9SPHI|nr:YetF domain-containing protein [Pedobacter yulinensis]PST82790.1 DUF421 domain-containing protein [Pedobacter yulinensis]